jgi:hypothetical protein
VAFVYYLMHPSRYIVFLDENTYARCLLGPFKGFRYFVDYAVSVEQLTKFSLLWNGINWFISFLTDRKFILKFESGLLQPKIMNLNIVLGS